LLRDGRAAAQLVEILRILDDAAQFLKIDAAVTAIAPILCQDYGEWQGWPDLRQRHERPIHPLPAHPAPNHGRGDGINEAVKRHKRIGQQDEYACDENRRAQQARAC
jgi:hypothetical protein